MQFSAQSGWTYNNYKNTYVCKVTNNDGKTMQLNSITLYLGKLGNYTCTAGDTVTGTGRDIPNAYLSGGGYTSSGNRITNTCSRRSYSGGTYPDTSSDVTTYTFTFSSPIIMSNGSSISFNMVWTDNALVMRKNGGYISAEEYNPYTAPSYDITDITQIGRVGRDTWTVKYKIDGGTNNISWTHGDVLDTSNSYIGVYYDFGTSKGNPVTKTFTPTTSQLAHGKEYRMRIVFDDGNRYETGTKTFYTYQEPTLSGLSADKTEVNANSQSITFTMSGINNRTWTSLEDNFITHAYCSVDGSRVGNDWTTVGTAGTANTFSLSGATLRSFVPKSSDGTTVTVHVRRRNGRADWNTAEKTATFKVYYKPRKGVTCANISYRKNNSNGVSIGKGALLVNDNTLTGIYVSWAYDTTTADAGYTQGYRIRVYNKTGTTVAKTYYTSNKYYIIPKADIPKMQDTYIDVTPYFKNDTDNTGGYWYYDSPTKCDFVVMASKIDKPSITYPVEGSDWINTKFRVCFQLPNDPDKGSETDNYTYEDVEVEVNGKVFRITANPEGMTTGGVQCADAFSTTTLSYQKKIVVAPFKASNFPTATTYKIRVRVKKKYTEVKNNWSEWSSVRTFTVTPASFTPSRGDIIYATHYNNAKKVINRVRNTYGVAWNSQPADVSKGTVILRSQYPYANWYDRIVATKKQVNDYATFDSSKTAVRFDSTNAIKENFTQYIELVTAASNEDKSDASGRDYMRIVYDRCNRLI